MLCGVASWKFHYNDVTDLLLTYYRLVGDKSVTSWQLPRLRGSYGETGVMDFSLHAATDRQTDGAPGRKAYTDRYARTRE